MASGLMDLSAQFTALHGQPTHSTMRVKYRISILLKYIPNAAIE